jgi:hypothetical protein
MECKLSVAQTSLLTRTQARMKLMNQVPSAYILSIILRANDMPPEDLNQVREWLAAHQDDAPEPEDPRGKQFTTKPETAVSDPGVDESKKEIPKMAGTTTQAPMDSTWILRMDEEAKKGGNFLKMEPNDDKTVVFLTNPVEGISEYEGKARTEFKATVKNTKSGEQMVWAIRQKEVMQQLVAIMKANGLSNLVGVTMDLSTRGPDAKTKHWFLRLAATPAQAQPRPEPIPVSDADREAAIKARQEAAQAAPQAVPGAEWIAQQKEGMAAPGAR